MKWNSWTIISLLLIIAGILFFIGWGIAYGVWFDIGTYAVAITLILFGGAGYMLSQRPVEQ